MSEAQFTRKLATIIAVDVCGYARLVEENEERAIHSVDACREMIERIIVSHGGRIFNHAGDGVMAETPSAVEGVRAAFEIQRELKTLNAAAPDAPPIAVRIGVNLGDVVVKEDGDLAGHGVNIAARLESIAEKGEILISHAVYEQIKGAVEELFEAAGYEKLKHIDAPVAVYRAAAEAETGARWLAGRTRRAARKHWRFCAALAMLALIAAAAVFLRPRPSDAEISLAVLPFVNLSQDPDNRYFSDGVTEEILSALVRLDDVTVIGRTSSFQFREAGGDFDDIRRRLNVSHILEGSVRRDGDRVRVSAQLIGAGDGVHIWSESFDRRLDGIFEIQSEIAASIAGALKVNLGSGASASDSKIDPQTYEIYLRGRSLLSQRGAAIPQAIALFETVTARAPEFAHGWASLASALHVLPGYSDVSNEEIAERALRAAARALELDPGLADARAVLAAQHRRRGEWARAEDMFLEALQYEPNNISALYWYAEFLMSVGRFEASLPYFRKAYAVDPLSPYTSAGVGWALYFSGDVDGAEQEFLRAWDEFGMTGRQLWEGILSVYLEQGRLEDAAAFLDALQTPGESKALFRAFLDALRAPSEETAAALQAGFARSDDAGGAPFYWKYEAFARLGDRDAALDAALAAARAGAIGEPQALFSPAAKHLWSDGRFQQVADALGLTAYWRERARPDFCASAELRRVCTEIGA